jgi:hypothetical protein
MSTLDIPAPRVTTPRSRFGGLARIVSALRLVLEVLSEAKQQAYEAKRRYPFTSW